jgi:membrane-bound metal-dependent hydrolase YbcI (DUF457 family)
MPFTPFHFGPSAFISLALMRYIDLPVFILANVAIDIEPLIVMVFKLSYPLHGMAHTFLSATIIGIFCGAIFHYFRKPISYTMTRIVRLPYSTSFKKYAVSGVLGAWFHILLDSPLYYDIKPFYPLSDKNPLLGLVPSEVMYKFCALTFIPAIMLYLLLITIEYKKQKIL